MKARLCIDDAVGERRRLLRDMQGRAFRLDIERWSERGARVRLGDIRWGRVKARIPGGRGWFVDIGGDADGVVEPTRAAHMAEGALLAFRVKAEAWSDKGPLLSLADMSPKAPKPDGPGLHAAAEEDMFLAGVEVQETLEGVEAREALDAAIDEAMGGLVQLPGGGDIAVEAVRGATVIDVDAAQRAGAQDAERFALDLNLAAAEAAARLISLRGTGGLVLIDFVGMARPESRRAVAQALRETLAGYLGRASEVLELSRLGVCEAAVARRARPLADALAAPAAEREALEALRLIETLGVQDRAARLAATVSLEAAAWLAGDTIGWREALAGRIGARWTLDAKPGHTGRPDVRKA